MLAFLYTLVTFCVSCRRRKMYCGHARLSVCLSAAVRPHYCTDPDVTWGRGRGCPLVVHYWADLQSVHRLRCYGNITRDGGVHNITAAAWTAGFQWWRSGDITRTQNVCEYMIVLALCLAKSFWPYTSKIPTCPRNRCFRSTA